MGSEMCIRDRLYYAGDGLFSFEEDLYNPRQFVEMMSDWQAAKLECEKRALEPKQRQARTQFARSTALDSDSTQPVLSNVRPPHQSVEKIPQPIGRFPIEEIENAFENYQKGLAKAGRTNDWRHFGLCLTPDTTLIDCGLGHLGKREAVVDRIETELHQQDLERPWFYLNYFPVGEYVIDPQRDTVWAFFWVRFRDPGDGTRHEAKVFVRAVYDGDGLFKEIETLYNPDAIEAAMASYLAAKASYDQRREKRAKSLAERERKAREMAPLKLDETGKEI